MAMVVHFVHLLNVFICMSFHFISFRNKISYALKCLRCVLFFVVCNHSIERLPNPFFKMTLIRILFELDGRVSVWMYFILTSRNCINISTNIFISTFYSNSIPFVFVGCGRLSWTFLLVIYGLLRHSRRKSKPTSIHTHTHKTHTNNRWLLKCKVHKYVLR